MTDWVFVSCGHTQESVLPARKQELNQKICYVSFKDEDLSI